MCERAVEKCLHPLRFIPDYLKTQKMCEKAVEKDPYQLGDFPDYLKTQEMCEKLLKKTHGGCTVSLIVLKLKKCATRLLK